MSNDESAIGPLLGVIGRFVFGVHPRCTLLLAPNRIPPARRTQAGCPSGQWERTVNPSAEAYTGSNPVPATLVRPPHRGGLMYFWLNCTGRHRRQRHHAGPTRSV